MNLGPLEILVILVVALIVFGPKRLPEVGRQVGAAMRELRRMQDTVKSEINTVMHPDMTPNDQTGPEEPDHTALPQPTAEQLTADDRVDERDDDRFPEPPGSFT
jgi:TatA/E family protein of Tat protein translocase